MNCAIRVLVLSVAAGTVASNCAPIASGQIAGRRGVGNSAEVERLERERRDRLERESDLRERQFLLRNIDADRRPAERPEPRLAVAQIRADFARLQIVNNDLARAVSGSGSAPDLKFVSKSASEIGRLARRLRDNLALPGQKEGRTTHAPKVAADQLKAVLSALDALVLRFADGLATRGVGLLDAQSSLKARQELDDIITLSERAKKVSEKLEKAEHRPK